MPGGAAVDGVIKLPDGTELPVDAAKAKALVTPAAFADAVSDTLEKVRLMGVERRVLEETAEEIRQVAKEARAVIEEAYDGETLDAFSEALAPAFKNSLSPDFYKPTPAPDNSASMRPCVQLGAETHPCRAAVAGSGKRVTPSCGCLR